MTAVPENGNSSSRQRAIEELQSAQKLLVVTHENPDGDALGSLLAMRDILRALGKDAEAFIDPRELPLPQEYRFLPLDAALPEPPADPDERNVGRRELARLS